MYLHENTSVICLDVKKDAYLHAITADITEWVYTVGNAVRQYCRWKWVGETALGGYSMPKHHA